MSKFTSKLIIAALIISFMPATVFAMIVEPDPTTESVEGANTESKIQPKANMAETREAAKTAREEKIAELKAMRVEERCQKVQENVDQRIQRYSENQENVTARFNGIITKTEAVSKRLSDAGADTSTLESYISQLEDMMADLSTNRVQIVNQLGELKTSACGNDTEARTAARESVKEARETLLQLEKSSREARSLVREQILTEIKNLIETIKN